MSSRANAITNNVINFANSQGCNTFRNNVLGVFDQKIALEKIHELVQFNQIFRAKSLNEFIKENVRLVKALKESYRKSNERIGASDILGFSKTGKFIAIEIKGKKDQPSIEQQSFLKEVADKGGIAILVAEEPEKIKVQMWGFRDAVLICSEDEFYKKFRSLAIAA